MKKRRAFTMGYYDEIDQNNRVERKKNSLLKPVLSSLISGVLGGAVVYGALTYLPFQDHNKASNETEHAAVSQNTNDQEASVNVAKISNQGDIAEIAEKLSPAIVGISNLQQQRTDWFGSRQGSSSEEVESGSGTGIIFKKSGNDVFIVTNNHVIEGASSLEVTLSNGDKEKAEVVGADSLTDLAVIKINNNSVNTVAEFGDSDNIRVGDQVIAIGNPLGSDLSRTVTEGIISGVNRTVTITTSEGDWALDVIQTDAAINPGNSGGPLINMDGKVIGVSSMKISQEGVEGLGFAIPSNDVVKAINQLMEKGKIDRPFLGVALLNVSELPEYFLRDTLNLPSDVKEGAVVGRVQANSPADQAGLQEKDVIVALDGQSIHNTSELRKYLYSEKKSGDSVKVKLYRDGKEKTVTVTLSSQDLSQT
ncbi:peptidase S1 [Bacillaceae bacterium ZC4]|nr:peptidase S1 [Bacillaceae bacterium ZC4]